MNDPGGVTESHQDFSHPLCVAPFSMFTVLSDEEKQTNASGYFCDWFPELFGIDEEEIPDSEDGEGIFDIDWNELQDQALTMTESQMDRLRVGSWECLTEEELKRAWLTAQQPRYGRRARQKPILYKENQEPFECICDIDLHYSRQYISKFGGGVAKEGEELKVPHFRAFWEDLKNRKQMGDMEKLSKIFNPQEKATTEGDSKRKAFKFANLKKCNLQKFRKNLLDTLRPLHCREVRRYRMPYSEALYLELQEDDCLNGAAFFKYLIIKDHYVHNIPDNSGPHLRNNRTVMNQIFDILKLTDKLSRREEYDKESMLYLRAGKYFNDDKNWWWLAEEFYKKAVNVSKNCVIDGGKSEAISNYILGMFLLDCVQRVQGAQEHLLRARELSMGKDWNARSILRRPQDTVHKECAIYLCRALIAASKELRAQGKPEEALPLIHRSFKLGEELESWRSDIEMETFFEMGMTYQALGMLDWAKTAFRKFIGLAEIENYVKGVCDGYLELAICYRREGDQDRCLRNILSFLTAAKLKENHNLMAFGNRYLGEFYLNNGECKEAAEYFKKAFQLYLEQYTQCKEIPFSEWQPEHFTLGEDVELTRVLFGLAQGEMLTKPICTLILQATEADGTNGMLRLIDWKNKGESSRLKGVEIKEVKEKPRGREKGKEKEKSEDEPEAPVHLFSIKRELTSKSDENEAAPG